MGWIGKIIPKTDVHKLAGVVVGGLASWATGKGIDLTPQQQAWLTVALTVFFSTIISKFTNPTGANRSDARKTLENQTGTGSGT